MVSSPRQRGVGAFRGCAGSGCQLHAAARTPQWSRQVKAFFNTPLGNAAAILLFAFSISTGLLFKAINLFLLSWILLPLIAVPVLAYIGKQARRFRGASGRRSTARRREAGRVTCRMSAAPAGCGAPAGRRGGGGGATPTGQLWVWVDAGRPAGQPGWQGHAGPRKTGAAGAGVRRLQGRPRWAQQDPAHRRHD